MFRMSVTSFPCQIRFSSSRLSQRVEVTEGRFLNGGTAMCLDTPYDINSERQHNCSYYTRYLHRLHVSTIQPSSLSPFFTG